MVKFGMMGALGRMGKTIAALSKPMEGIECVAGFDNPKHPSFSEGILPGYFPDGEGLHISEISAQTAGEINGLIDFSLPEASEKYLPVLVEKKIPVVIGTTGFSDEQRKKIEEASNEIPVLMATNMSVGVNMLFALTEIASKILIEKGFHPEISEIHHRHKKDAPSGTAKTLEEIVCKAAGFTSQEVVYGRNGITGERPDRQLGVFALRGGDVVGDHTVFFLGSGERIELKHQAVSRETFAAGALNALKFIADKKPGMYNMRDVLNLPSF